MFWPCPHPFGGRDTLLLFLPEVARDSVCDDPSVTLALNPSFFGFELVQRSVLMLKEKIKVLLSKNFAPKSRSTLDSN